MSMVASTILPNLSRIEYGTGSLQKEGVTGVPLFRKEACLPDRQGLGEILRLLQMVTALALSVFLVGCTSMQTQTIQVGTGMVQVAVARTPEQMAKGLSGRRSLAPNQGMLFVYDEPTMPKFWMKGMNFSIDIVWLRRGTVVGIESDVPVDDSTARYAPTTEIDAVLELAAGVAANSGLTVGDRITYAH